MIHDPSQQQQPTNSCPFRETPLFKAAFGHFNALLTDSNTQVRFGGNAKLRIEKQERFSQAFLDFFCGIGPDIQNYVQEDLFVRLTDELFKMALKFFTMRYKDVRMALGELIKTSDNADIVLMGDWVSRKAAKQNSEKLFFDLAMLTLLKERPQFIPMMYTLLTNVRHNLYSEWVQDGVAELLTFNALMTDAAALSPEQVRLLEVSQITHYLNVVKQYQGESEAIIDTRVADMLRKLPAASAAPAPIAPVAAAAAAVAEAAVPQPTQLSKDTEMTTPTTEEVQAAEQVLKIAPTSLLAQDPDYLTNVKMRLFDFVAKKNPQDIKKIEAKLEKIGSMKDLVGKGQEALDKVITSVVEKDGWGKSAMRMVSTKTTGEKYLEADEESQANQRRMLGHGDEVQMHSMFGRPFLSAAFPEFKHTPDDNTDHPITQKVKAAKARVGKAISDNNLGFGAK